jgi:hypothetical protein
VACARVATDGTIVSMIDNPGQTVDRMLEKGWYSPTDAARAATHALVVAVVQMGFVIPSVGATMFKGTQCEWAGKGGVVMVLFDDSGHCSLVVVRYGEADADVVDLPTTDQIVTALQTL